MSMLEHSLNLPQLSHTLTLNLILTLIKLKLDFFWKSTYGRTMENIERKNII